MVTFEKFKQIIKTEGSYQSARFNSLVLGGVDGMPTTHQIGYGKAIRLGINPAHVNRDWLNGDTHSRMNLVLGGAIFTGVITPIKMLSLLSGSLTAIGFYELYQDWRIGFQAVNYLPQSYFNEFQPIKNVGHMAYQY